MSYTWDGHLLDGIASYHVVHLQVCQAYDTAEFCRNVHSCSEWQEAATRACVTVGGKKLPNQALLGLDCDPRWFDHPAKMFSIQAMWSSSIQTAASTGCLFAHWMSMTDQLLHAQYHSKTLQ